MPEDMRPDDLEKTEYVPEALGDSVRIGPYFLRQKIGEGGMGEVWLADQKEPIHRQVALKVIKKGMDSRQVVARFEAERQALALMDHPAIARIYDAGTTPGGQPYFAMEYVKGVPITEHCDRHKLGMRERLQLFCEVCEAVQHAHQKAVIHRDLKPGNILVSIEGSVSKPKVIDFGVAKATSQKLTEQTLHTQFGMVIGTPAYMSPEQADLTGQDVDVRTDVYALGVILYELLVGALPFEAEEFQAAGLEGIVRLIRDKDPPRPSTRLTSLGDRSTTVAEKRNIELRALKRELGGDLDWITLRAMEKDRTRRYDSVRELGHDIERYLNDEPVLACPPSLSYRTGKFVRRHRLAVISGALVVLALVGGIAGTTVGLLRARAAESVARQQAARADRTADYMAGMLRSMDPLAFGEGLRQAFTARMDDPAPLANVNMMDIAQELLDEQVLAHMAGTIEVELQDEPAMASALYRYLSEGYREGLQLYQAAEDMGELALARAAEAGEPDSELAMQATSALAWALFRIGTDENRARARDLMQQYVDTMEPRHGRNSPELLGARMSLADFKRTLGQAEEAEAEFRELIPVLRDLQARELPGAHLLPYTLNDLALTIAVKESGYEEADALYLEAIALAESSWGRLEWQSLNMRRNRLMLMRRMGRATEVVEAGSGLVADLEASQGSEAAVSIHVVGMVAGAYRDLGQDDEARAWYERGIRYGRRNRARDPETARLSARLMYGLGLSGGTNSAITHVREFERELRFTSVEEFHLENELWFLLYAAACLESLRGDREAGLTELARAVDAGLDTPVSMRNDPDLELLHGPEFDTLVARAERNASRGR